MTKTIKFETWIVLALMVLTAPSQAQSPEAVSSSPSTASPGLTVEYGIVGEAAGTTDSKQSASFLSKAAPVYPREEKCEGVTGKIVLLVTVSMTGDPVRIIIEQTSHNRHLDRAALEAAQKWKFKPALNSGKSTETVVRVPVEFQVTKDSCVMRTTDSEPVGKH